MLLTLGVVCAPAAGQTPARRPILHLASLARLAPEGTGVFIEFERLDHLNEQLRTVNAWRLVKLLGERTTGSPEGAVPSVDWDQVLTANLGVTPAVAFEQLFSRQVALAAPDWDHLHDGVILLRLPNRKALEHLVRRGNVRRARRSGPRVKVYQTKAGLWVATDDKFVALSQRSERTLFYRKTLELLAGRSTASLARLGVFIDQMNRLPPRHLGVVYFDLPPARRPRPQDGARPAIRPMFRRGAVGVYLGPERADFIFRCVLATPRDRTVRPHAPVARLDRLPQTTLLAWGTSVDLRGAFQSLMDAPASGLGGILASLIKRVLDPEQLEQDLVARLGPRVIFVWGQDPRGESSVPQLAVLLESQDAAGAAAVLEQAVQAITTGMGRAAGDNAPSPGLTHTEHLGATIAHLPFSELVSGAPAGSLVSRMGGIVRPSFAALDGWLVMALTPEHVREIIDADRGVIPSLGDAPELAWAGKRWARSAVLGLAQPSAASQVMEGWLEPSARGDDTFLANLLGLTRSEVEPRPTLGIGMRVEQEPGRVRVARVYPGTPSDGRLAAGDDIVGVNGHLLSLTEPNASLRRVVRAVKTPQTLTLRVLRDAKLMDVAVQLGAPTAPASRSGTTAEALRRLARLGQELRYAAYAVSASRPDQLVAHLRLGLKPAAQSAATLD